MWFSVVPIEQESAAAKLSSGVFLRKGMLSLEQSLSYLRGIAALCVSSVLGDLFLKQLEQERFGRGPY